MNAVPSSNSNETPEISRSELTHEAALQKLQELMESRENLLTPQQASSILGIGEDELKSFTSGIGKKPTGELRYVRAQALMEYLNQDAVKSTFPRMVELNQESDESWVSQRNTSRRFLRESLELGEEGGDSTEERPFFLDESSSESESGSGEISLDELGGSTDAGQPLLPSVEASTEDLATVILKNERFKQLFLVLIGLGFSLVSLLQLSRTNHAPAPSTEVREASGAREVRTRLFLAQIEEIIRLMCYLDEQGADAQSPLKKSGVIDEKGAYHPDKLRPLFQDPAFTDRLRVYTGAVEEFKRRDEKMRKVEKWIQNTPGIEDFADNIDDYEIVPILQTTPEQDTLIGSIDQLGEPATEIELVAYQNALEELVSGKFHVSVIRAFAEDAFLKMKKQFANIFPSGGVENAGQSLQKSCHQSRHAERRTINISLCSNIFLTFLYDTRKYTSFVSS